jgi:PqqD family protein of HPr-rel-A system
MRAPSSLRWRRWSDGYIRFHVPSGDTHLADPLLAEALLRLRDGPATIRALAGDAGGDAAAAAARHLADSFAALRDAGVLEVDG